MKVIINIATKGDRPEQLAKTLDSLKGQADAINVHDNSKGPIDYTDNAKFSTLKMYKEPVYYLTCDDDIIYPLNYVNNMKYAIEKYKCIVSFHGRILKPNASSYYSGHDVYDFRQHCPESKIVDVGGTGVMGFRTDYFNPTELYKSEYKCMSDLVLSLEAKKQGKTIVMASHLGNWLIQQEVNDMGIMKSHKNNQNNQIKLANQILEL